MPSQLIQLSILNTLLGLPKDNPLQSTLFILNDLIIFKNNNKNLKSMMIRLQQQISKFKIKVSKQINQYIQYKIQLLKQELQNKSRVIQQKQRDRVSSNSKDGGFDVKKFMNFDSIQKYMQEQYKFKWIKIENRGKEMKIRQNEEMNIVIMSQIELINKYKNKQNQKKQIDNNLNGFKKQYTKQQRFDDSY